MAKRFVDTELWDKEWFMGLSPKHKCLMKFIFDKCDVAGIWEENWVLATTYVGEKCSSADMEFLKEHVIKFRPGKFLVPDFIHFQYGKLSESSNPHQKIISILKKNRLYQGYLRGTPGVLDMDMEKEKEVDKEKDKGGTGGKMVLVYPFNSEQFLSLWEQWVVYRKEIKKPYQTFSSQQAALQALSKYPEETAIEMIKQSIAAGWKEIYKLKEDNGNSKKGFMGSDKQSDLLSLVTELRKSDKGSQGGDNPGGSSQPNTGYS